ncbi:unnamed protein product [Amoebophrya sp. A25]|nr:unnamed protein product [Amoebophrya sp. A25]|eukprot:GSA25T00025801001.1
MLGTTSALRPPLRVVLLLATSAKRLNALSGKTDRTLSHVEVHSTGAALQEQEDSASSDGSTLPDPEDADENTTRTRRGSRSSLPSPNDEESSPSPYVEVTARTSPTTTRRLQRRATEDAKDASIRQVTREELEEEGVVLNQENPDAKTQETTGTGAVDQRGSVVAGQEASSTSTRIISGSKGKAVVSTSSSTSTSPSLIEEDAQNQKASSRGDGKVETNHPAAPAGDTTSTSSKLSKGEDTIVTDSIQGRVVVDAARQVEPAKDKHSSSTNGETEFLEDTSSQKSDVAASTAIDTSAPASGATDWYVYVDYVTSYIDTSRELPADFGSKALGDAAFLDILQKEIVTATGIQSVTVPQYQPGAPARVYDFTIPTAPEPPLITLGILLLTALGILELATIASYTSSQRKRNCESPCRNLQTLTTTMMSGLTMIMRAMTQHRNEMMTQDELHPFLTAKAGHQRHQKLHFAKTSRA